MPDPVPLGAWVCQLTERSHLDHRLHDAGVRRGPRRERRRHLVERRAVRDPRATSSSARLERGDHMREVRRAARCGWRAASARAGGTPDRGTSGRPARGRRTPACRPARPARTPAPSTRGGRSRRTRRAADRRTRPARARCSVARRLQRARHAEVRAAEGESCQVDVHHRDVGAAATREGGDREADRSSADDEDGRPGRRRCAPHRVRADASVSTSASVSRSSTADGAASAPAAAATRACRRRRARRAPAAARSSCRGRGGRPGTRRSQIRLDRAPIARTDIGDNRPRSPRPRRRARARGSAGR